MRNTFLFLIINFGVLLSCKKEQSKSVVDVTTNLVAYYPFTGNANDSSGNLNNGIVNGATLTTDRKGNTNSAYLFNGIDNYIEVKNLFFNNGWENMTVSLWFNAAANSIPYKGNTFLNTIPHGGFNLGINYSGNNLLYVFKNSNTGCNFCWDILSFNYLKFIPNNDQWYHLSVVKSGLQYRFYIDGKLDKTVESTTVPQNAGCSIIFGTLALYSDYFKGKLDEIRIYNRALIDDQISYLAKL